MRALTVVLLLAGSHGAAAETPWLDAVSEAFTIVDTAQGDLNKNGITENALCYVDDVTGRGGVLVLEKHDGVERPVFHTQFAGGCDKIKIIQDRLGIQYQGGDKKQVWQYGKDLAFAGDARHVLAGIKATASSEKSPAHRADRALDRDIKTSWAEGKEGTGIGETLTIELPRASTVAFVGVYAGNGISEEQFFANNRLHRLSVQPNTSQDLGDSDIGLDFDDLGIDVGGARIEQRLPDKPGFVYVRVGQDNIKEIKLRIDSVFLGSKGDDLHIAEVDVVVVRQLDDMILPEGKAGQVNAPKKAPPTPEKHTTKSSGDRVDRATRALDGDGRSVVDDVEF